MFWRGSKNVHCIYCCYTSYCRFHTIPTAYICFKRLLHCLLMLSNSQIHTCSHCIHIFFKNIFNNLYNNIFSFCCCCFFPNRKMFPFLQLQPVTNRLVNAFAVASHTYTHTTNSTEINRTISLSHSLYPLLTPSHPCTQHNNWRNFYFTFFFNFYKIVIRKRMVLQQFVLAGGNIEQHTKKKLTVMLLCYHTCNEDFMAVGRYIISTAGACFRIFWWEFSSNFLLLF